MMVEDIRNVKKKVREDWQNAFPQLGNYAQNKYYKILGPLLTGIELKKLPRVEDYRPHFVIYSLWGNKAGKDLKACLSGPIMLSEFYNRKGLQFSIPYLEHSSKFPELLEAVNTQLPFSLEGDVRLDKVLFALEEYSKTSPLSAAPNSYLQAALQEYKLEIALCIGAEKQALAILAKIKTKNWDLAHFSLLDIDYEKWLNSIEEKINNKDELLLQLSTNRQDKRLKKLQQSELRE